MNVTDRRITLKSGIQTKRCLLETLQPGWVWRIELRGSQFRVLVGSEDAEAQLEDFKVRHIWLVQGR